jgi:hypothetical protein
MEVSVTCNLSIWINKTWLFLLELGLDAYEMDNHLYLKKEICYK